MLDEEFFRRSKERQKELDRLLEGVRSVPTLGAADHELEVEDRSVGLQPLERLAIACRAPFRLVR